MANCRYIPILKYKGGELWALGRVMATTKPRTSPLMEMHSDDNDGVELVDDLMNNWGGYPAFVETDSATVLQSMLDEAMSQNYIIIPVTRILKQPIFQTTLATHPATAQNGLMLRLSPADFALSTSLSVLINNLLSVTGRNKSDVDLLLDLGQIVTPGAAAAMSLGLIPQVPNLNQWRSFTIASAGFPASTTVQAMPPGAWHRPLRHDWNSWLNIRGQAIPRLPDYSDYTVREPGFPPAFPPRNVTIRYTTDNVFMVRREPKSTTPPVYSPASAICADLITLPEFSGANFSAGDQAIQQRATNPGSPGSPVQWIREAVNHHIEFVVAAIANLP